MAIVAPSAARIAALPREVSRLWPGLLLAVVIAIAATFIADNRGGPALLYALLIGMALNGVAAEGNAKRGIDFSARHVLRWGVALLGARITAEQLIGVGWQGGAVVIVSVVATIAFGIAAAKSLGLSRRLGVLTGGATAICGASAAIAVAAVLPHDEESERELLFTIAGVTALSTLAMIAYPVVVSAAGLDARGAGSFLGGTIHDVAQVVGAGYSISQQVGDYAVLTKLLRVAMLLPVVMAIAFAARHRVRATGDAARERLLPGFLVAFAVLAAVGSAGWIAPPIAAAMNDVSRACLVVAIAAVGLKTSAAAMVRVGARAFALLCAEALLLAALVLAAQKL